MLSTDWVNSFREQGFAMIGAPFSLIEIATLRAHFAEAMRRRTLKLGDSQSPLRFVSHNDPITRGFHSRLVPLVSSIVCSQVKPSYTYFSAYVEGANLPRHCDRSQCEYTISLLVDCFPLVCDRSPWPLCLGLTGGDMEVHLGIGEAVLFQGTKISHWRPHLQDGHTSSSIFFHYVDQSFRGPLD
jgi:hypothetical protein